MMKNSVITRSLFFLYNIVIILFFFNSPLFGAAFFSVAPGVIEFNLKKHQTKSFIVSNSGDERIRLIVRPIYFAIDSKSLRAGIAIDPETANQDDLTKAILISPRVMVLSPGQKRTVRISIRTKKELSPGDYRTHLLISTMEGRKSVSDQSASSSGTEGMSIDLNIRMETAIAIYGRVGTADTKLDWRCGKNSQGIFFVQTINQSNWNFRGWLGIYGPEENSELITEVRLVSLRNSVRTIPIKNPPATPFNIRWGYDPKTHNISQFLCQLEQ